MSADERHQAKTEASPGQGESPRPSRHKVLVAGDAMSGNPFDLARFVSAQAGVFDAAADELRAGRKRTHWMWFVSPSCAAWAPRRPFGFYAISSLDEATAYLQHPVLGRRLDVAVSAVQSSPAPSLNALFGSPDDLKFRSSMTLFAVAGPEGPFREALGRWCDGEPDHLTVALLRQVGETS